MISAWELTSAAPVLLLGAAGSDIFRCHVSTSVEKVLLLLIPLFSPRLSAKEKREIDGIYVY